MKMEEPEVQEEWDENEEGGGWLVVGLGGVGLWKWWRGWGEGRVETNQNPGG